MPKLTPEEILRSIEEPSVDDEIDRVLSMSAEQRRDELRAAGYDLDTLHSEADALHEKLLGSPGETRAKPPQTRAAAAPPTRTVERPRMLLLLAAALCAAVSVAVSVPTAVVVARHVAAPAGAAIPAPPAPSQGAVMPEVDVADLRGKSLEACDDGRWIECLLGLDRARHVDPGGEADPRVQLARREAIAGLTLRRDRLPVDVDSKEAPKK